MKRQLPFAFYILFLLLFTFSPGNKLFALEVNSYNFGEQRVTKLGDNEIAITIEPMYDYSKINKLSLIVEISFKGDETGKTILLIPDKFNDIVIDNCYRNLISLSPGCYIEENGISNQRVINHPPKSVVTFKYELVDTRKFSEVDVNLRYQPILNENYFHIFGETFFILPLTNWNKEHLIKLSWINLPKNWILANSFGTYKSKQEIKSNLWAFRQSVFVGGNDIRIIPKFVANQPVYIAVRGSFQFNDQVFSDFIWSVLNEARSFWNDKKYSDYLVTLLPVSDRNAYYSEGRENSFSLFVGPKKELDYSFKKMVAHETFQNWLGRKITPEEPKQIVQWFFAGFGEYYSRLLLLRANKITLEEYIDEYNYVLEQNAKSSFRDQSSTQMSSSMNDPDFVMLQYYRGDILAHNLNTAIFNYSSGKRNLDDFMLDLYNRTKNEDLQISNGVLSALIRFYAGERTLSEIMSTVNSGRPIKPRPDALGRCAVLRTDFTRKYWILGEQYELFSYVFNKDLYQQNKNEFMRWFSPLNEQ